MNKLDTSGSFIIGYDFSKYPGILIVGTKTPKNDSEIINAFEGEEAKKIYNMLISKRKDVKNGNNV